eukprot:CAMPEP_0179055030 /NCGR_PEP_ID=MMETSP0796-20121207/23091_1 /TAXON_ID=73915 /ORGANISM="Pyrodinium bahamense, Strain pbaha01" /LENGTH=70 /DNA_ID=CAMNT_0020751671 /DNA_START=69 /DNA_END=278 /DNA_ORIENTATION=+
MPCFSGILVVLAFSLQIGAQGSRSSELAALDLHQTGEVSQYCKKADGGTCLAKCDGCFKPCEKIGLTFSE